MKDKRLEGIEEQLGKRRNFDAPPLQLWQPDLSGDIPIHITADGDWYHEGVKIKREALVRLFASILRREEDGEYYLVTPVEKWRINVECHPLTVIDIGTLEESGILIATLNTGKTVQVDETHPLFLDAAAGDIAVLQLDHGLTAIFNRAAWYRLVDLAQDIDGTASVRSGAAVFALVN